MNGKGQNNMPNGNRGEQSDNRTPSAKSPVNVNRNEIKKLQTVQPSQKTSHAETVDWGSEILKALRIIGKVALKACGYVLNVLITIVLICVITGIIVGTAFLIYLNNYVDTSVDMSLFSINKDQTTTIYYTDYTDRENRIGTDIEIEDQRLYGSENSLWASYNEMPQDLIDAFVAMEDKRFWDHHGVDWIRTGGAVLNFIVPGGNVYGGSTITQQLIKNITGDDQVTIQRKVQEILRALNLEKSKSKEEILEMYLNIVYLAQNCNGVKTAANTYFNKDVSELTLIECASLASIVQNPSKYDPYTHPDKNKLRRDSVLEQMKEQGKITDVEYEEAINTELVVELNKRSDTNVSTNSWFTDALIEDVIDDLVAQKGYSRAVASNLIYSGGLRIYSTVDPEVQTILEEEYANDENFPKTTGIKPESAMVVIDRATGDIVGLVGGREKVGNRVLNRATQSTRPPGSSIKPVSVYGPALEYGLITCATVFDDVPVNFGEENDTAWPKNLPERYGGLTTVSDALRRSVNTVAVRILQNLTIDRSFDFIYNKLNCKSLIEGKTLDSGAFITDKGVAALALGQLEYGITVRELTSAYSMLANGGVYNPSHTYLKVLDSNGEVILSNENIGKVVMSEQNAYIMTMMMEEVVKSGTATAVTLDEKIEVAGKTGTTNADYDRWFVAFTPYYVCGVWLGFDYPKSLTNIAGSSHIKLWDTVMTKVHQKYIDGAANGGDPIKTFEMPSGIITAEYCTASGKIPTEACSLDPRGESSTIATGYFTASTLPTEPCDCHVKVAYCKESGCVLGPDCSQEESNIIYKGLIKVTSRSFPISVPVVDAQYVYRDLPSNVEPGDVGEEFFANLLEEDEYVGYSPGVTVPVNQYCRIHFDKKAFERRAAGLDEETTKAPETTKARETTRRSDNKKDTTRVFETTKRTETTETTVRRTEPSDTTTAPIFTWIIDTTVEDTTEQEETTEAETTEAPVTIWPFDTTAPPEIDP